MNRRPLRPLLMSSLIALFVICSGALPAVAQSSRPATVDGVPCEVCVSRDIVSQCRADADEGERCRADVARAYLRLELCDSTSADCARRLRDVEARLAAAERAATTQRAVDAARPSSTRVFLYGTAAGVVATLAALLVVVIVAD